MLASYRDSYREAMDNPISISITTKADESKFEENKSGLGSKIFKFLKICILGACVFIYDIYSKIYYKTKNLKSQS